MANINHVTLIVDALEPAARFYEEELGLEPVAAFVFDYPTAFFKFRNGQQLHLSEWEDAQSFRGHLCITVDDFNAVFHRMKALGIIDTAPWGKVRQLPDGAMQMFVRDPSGNLVEITSHPSERDAIDPAIFADDLFQAGLYVSGRNDFRGYKAENATLYTGE
ncbi:VOC family protein [Neolewinella lacunae]|uniref:VOC family protein n=1 Tax=Neolewinella lacunae TaxID=1517758 RepID=A0A923T735_9BACT|nr:VOC family protein [Neolewinella lacunae]MBC6994075.1 VOC family protein [Neolewinella lacunae]MDN3636054.1 VOC family protein [Neolewinella lacunae]